MFEFLLKVWGLARPYKARLALGVLTGIIAGLMEPLLIATLTFVYGLIFPSADSASLVFSSKDFPEPAALIQKLSHPADRVSQFLANQFSTRDWEELTNAATASQSVLLAHKLNDLILSGPLYSTERFAGVSLSKETRDLLARNPHGEMLVTLNRLLLHDAYPTAVAAPSDLASQLPKWTPQFLREWTISAQQALTSGIKTHPGAVIALIAAIPVVMLLRSLFGYLNIYFLQWTAVRAITDLRTRLFQHLMDLSASFFNRNNTGELMSRTMSDTVALQSVISNSTAIMVKEPATLVGLLAFVMYREPGLTLMAMVVMPVCMIPIVVYNRKVRRSSHQLQTHIAELSGVMAESFTGNRVIKAYNLEPTVVEQFKAAARKFVGQTMRIVRSSEIPGPLLEAMGGVGVALVLVYVALRGGARPVPADFLAVIGSLFAMYRPFKNLARLSNNLEQARAASQRVFELLAAHNDIPEPAQPKPLRAAGVSIRFEDVHFAYDDKPVLQGINLTVNPGQLVALVGPSGSGKTTLTSLLLRFYDPQRGAVRIGSVDLREVSSRDLRDQIAVVTQETILFNETILLNIELGRPGASREQIIEAAKHAHAYDFVMDKPGGFETVIGERGTLLSGGQRQRLAIARAVLKNAPILILDEATSSLDTESERAVQTALEELMQGRTTICIAHRLSTVQKADLIVVLDAGRIVETGTHARLIQAGGLYSKLYEMQFESPRT